MKAIKGLNLQSAELEENLVRDINESNLPYVMVEPILSRLLNQISSKLPSVIDAEREAYEEALKKEQEEAEQKEGEQNVTNQLCKNIMD